MDATPPAPFGPARLGPLTLRNRLIRAGCFEGMCPDGVPGDALAEHHRALAAGGIGMTTVAYCAVARDGLAFGHEMWMRDEIVAPLRALTDGVHAEGAAAALQLGHCGFFASPAVIGARPMGPSAVWCTFRMSRSRAMTVADMTRVEDDFAAAARRAVEAGFDAVELHAGHGYLLSQFLSPWTNRRDDEHGGALDDRLRFPRAVVRRVREAIGPDRALVIKMNVEDGFDGGLTSEESVQVARVFAAEGADALVPSCGFTARTPLYMLRGDVPTRDFARAETDPLRKLGLRLFGNLFVPRHTFEPLFLWDDAAHIAEEVEIPVVLIGGVRSRDDIERALAAGFGFVQLGRPTVMDPAFARRLEAGEIEVSDCDQCNRCVATINAGPVRCVTRDEADPDG